MNEVELQNADEPQAIWNLDQLEGWLKAHRKKLAVDLWLYGRALMFAENQVKARREGWRRWLADNCPEISYKTAGRYIALAKAFSTIDQLGNTGIRQAYLKAGIIKSLSETAKRKKGDKRAGKATTLMIGQHATTVGQQVATVIPTEQPTNAVTFPEQPSNVVVTLETIENDEDWGDPLPQPFVSDPDDDEEDTITDDIRVRILQDAVGDCERIKAITTNAEILRIIGDLQGKLECALMPVRLSNAG